MALLRDGAKTNLARMGFNISAAASTAADGINAGAAKVKVIKSSGFTGSGISAQTYATFASEALYDSGASSNTRDPLTFATYKAQLTLNMTVVSDTAGDMILKMVGLDEAGGLLDSVLITFGNLATSADNTISFTQQLVSTSSPIARIMVFVDADAAGAAHNVESDYIRSLTASGRIEAMEETGDIPGRGVHVAVFEGVNGSASLNFHGANVIAGIPDSATAFIAGGASLEAPDYDLSTVLDMLQSLKFNVQRAMTISGAQLTAQALRGVMNTPPMSAAMHARSFGKIGRAFRKARSLARKTRDSLSDVARTVQPVIRDAGQILGSMEGRGAEVARLQQADDFLSDAQNRGFLKASYGSM